MISRLKLKTPLLFTLFLVWLVDSLASFGQRDLGRFEDPRTPGAVSFRGFSTLSGIGEYPWRRATLRVFFRYLAFITPSTSSGVCGKSLVICTRLSCLST